NASQDPPRPPFSTVCNGFLDIECNGLGSDPEVEHSTLRVRHIDRGWSRIHSHNTDVSAIHRKECRFHTEITDVVPNLTTQQVPPMQLESIPFFIEADLILVRLHE